MAQPQLSPVPLFAPLSPFLPLTGVLSILHWSESGAWEGTSWGQPGQAPAFREFISPAQPPPGLPYCSLPFAMRRFREATRVPKITQPGRG